VLVSSPRGPTAVTPFLPNLRELATSGVLAGNVYSTLRLSGSVEDVRRHLHAAERPRSQVIVIAATDEHADKARQLAQEAALVFTRLVDSRFGDRTPPLQAALFDSAHVLPAPNRHFLRNTLIGGGAGLILGALAAFLLGGGLREMQSGLSEAAVRDLRWRESTLEQRLKTVAQREKELAKRAGQLAAQERDFEKRAGEVAKDEDRAAERARELAERQRETEARERQLAAQQRELEAHPTPAPAAEPTPEPAAAPTVARVARIGAWNVNDLQSAAEARTDATTEQAEEWRTYLFLLREHASSDGSLPSQFDGLVDEVFGDLVR
jgi:DNA repair exonuclease SbcCD ATPase subunit